jgi:hypothetical protein
MQNRRVRKPATWNVSRLRTNLRKLYDEHVNEDIHYSGYYWYRAAHEWTHEVAHRYGVRPDVVAGIVAALSPGVTWDVNKRDAVALIEYFKGVRETEPTVSTYYHNVRKAGWIWNGQPIEGVLGGNKTRNFYLNILNPYDNHAVTIDRHAVKAARGMSKGGAVVITDAQYSIVAHAYRMEASRLGLTPCQFQAITWEAYKTKHNR